MIIVTTLGFDEKFALRAISRRGLKPDDEVIVLMPKPTDERVERAFQNFDEILKKAFQNPKISKVYVEVKDFNKALQEIIKAFIEKRNSKFLINLSGGLKVLILETFISFLLLNPNADIEIEFEDFSGLISFPLKICYPLILDKKDLKILNVLKNNPCDLSRISKETGISKTTVWRRLKKLQERNFIKIDERKYSLTEFGHLIVMFNF
ncbi:MAG: CRISPR-associated CARF protein Csa3 [Candidatus Methanomethylicaceae archaeon]